MFTNYRTVTIDNTKVSGSSNLTDFPIMVEVTDNGLKTVANGGHVTDSNGYDIIFTSDSEGETQLDHEIGDYDASTGLFRAYVKIPTLAHDEDTVIYMFYGDSTITTSQETTDTWVSGYKGVWHFDDDGNDSTSNGMDLTPTNSPSYVDGDWKRAVRLTYSSHQYFTRAAASCGALNIDGDQTWLCLCKNNTTSSDGYLMCHSIYGTESGHEITMHSNGKMVVRNRVDGTFNWNWYNVASISTSTNYLIATTINQTGDYIRAHIDANTWDSGSLSTPYVVTTSTTANADFMIGNRSDDSGTQTFGGDIYEARIYDGILSSDYLATTRSNWSDVSSFLSLGTEQDITPPAPDVTTNYLKFYRRTRFPGGITGL